MCSTSYGRSDFACQDQVQVPVRADLRDVVVEHQSAQLEIKELIASA